MRKIALLLLLPLFAIALSINAPAASAAPDNDNLADATDLGSGFSVGDTGTEIGASAEPGETSHAGFPATNTVWAKWTAPSDVAVVFDACHVSNFDTVMEVYTSPLVHPTIASLVSVGSDDDGCGGGTTGSLIKIAATKGTTYYVVIDRKAGGHTYAVVLRASPINDDFPGILLQGTNVSTTADNTGATKEPLEPDHGGVVGGGGASLWWSWEAPTTGTYTFSTCGSGFDTLLGVYSGGTFGAAFITEGSADSGCSSPFEAQTSFSVTAGTMYHIAVDGKQSSAPANVGTVRLQIGPGMAITPDTTEPDTSITSLVKKRHHRVIVEFVGSDDRTNGVTYECQVDAKPYAPCSSPSTFKFKKKKKHVVRVRAVDAAGNTDSSPAEMPFKFKH